MSEIFPGMLVRAADRDNIGTVTSMGSSMAQVHFVSPEGNEADVDLALELLTPLDGDTAAQARQVRPPARPISEFSSMLRRLERRAEGSERPIQLPWPHLNEQFCGGLWPGLHIVVGGTAVGKTQLGLAMAEHAVRMSVPVLYIGLELDALQLLARVVALRTGARWSDLYLGKTTKSDLQKLWVRLQSLEIPLYLEEGPPGGWPSSWLQEAADQIRAAYPEAVGADNQIIEGSRPILIIIDFLQLVSDAPGSRADPRERVGRAAYAARQVARTRNAAVVMISSAARDKYEMLNGDAADAAGLECVEGTHRIFTNITRPDAIVGSGKESGDVEYAGDTVSVAFRMNGHIVLATPKVRAGKPAWWALKFDGSDLREASEEEVKALAAGWQKRREEKTRKRTAKGEAKEAPSNGAEAKPTVDAPEADLFG